MTWNRELRDRLIAHATFLRRLSRSEAAALERLIRLEVVPEYRDRILTRMARIRSRGFDPGPWQTQRLRDVDEAIEALGSALSLAVEGRLEQRLVEIAAAELAFAVVALEDTTPDVVRAFVDFRSPSPRTLRAAIRTRPFQGRNLREWSRSVGSSTTRRLSQELRIGLAQGDAEPAMARRFDNVIQGTRRDARAVARTAVTHVTTRSREDVYRENSDVVDQVQYLATLDERTTVICAGLDGQVFPIGKGPRPPMHVNCRSETVPVVKSLAEILGVEQRGQIPPEQRASIDGPVDGKERYSTWLRRQSRARQERVLGEARAKLYRENRVPIDRFVDSDYRPLTLDQVLRREGLERKPDGSFGRIRSR